MNVWNMLKRKNKDIRRRRLGKKMDGRVNTYFFTEKFHKWMRAMKISGRA